MLKGPERPYKWREKLLFKILRVPFVKISVTIVRKISLTGSL